MELKDYEKVIINLINESDVKLIRLPEVAKALQCSRITAERRLMQMEIKGMLETKTYSKDDNGKYQYRWWKMKEEKEETYEGAD